jgi:protein-S-isoprenylcysteine O-methyltransferase Ste14
MVSENKPESQPTGGPPPGPIPIGARIWTSRVLVLAALFLFVFSAPRLQPGGWADAAMDSLGLILVMAGLFGRLWCSLFVSGYKTKHLIREGPYSVSRNPLYFFSLLGVTGVALAGGLLVLVAAVLLVFALYYPSVIHLEELKLRQIHGNDFEEYCRSTPRFWPRLSLYRSPDQYTFHPRLFLKTARDSSMFVLAFVAVQIIAPLHACGILPSFWSLY